MQSQLNTLILECNACGKIYTSYIVGSVNCTSKECLPICRCGGQDTVKDRDGIKPAIFVQTYPKVIGYDY